MRIFCLIENKYISYKRLVLTRRAMKVSPRILNIPTDPKKWSSKLMELGKFRVELEDVG
jgi:hypothetical protein